MSGFEELSKKAEDYYVAHKQYVEDLEVAAKGVLESYDTHNNGQDPYAPFTVDDHSQERLDWEMARKAAKKDYDDNIEDAALHVESNLPQYNELAAEMAKTAVGKFNYFN